jgi:hypothetical protein
LPSDATLVLGEDPAFGIPAFYASREEILPDGIYLLGNDIDQLGPHTSFARLIFVKLRNFFSYEKPNAFERIKDIKGLSLMKTTDVFGAIEQYTSLFFKLKLMDIQSFSVDMDRLALMLKQEHGKRPS